jgi:hypothetical protein
LEIILLVEQSPLPVRRTLAKLGIARRPFTAEASVYRLLKTRDLIASPAFIVIEPTIRSRTRLRPPTNCGRPISPISR